jgi:hypothetical protein
MTTDEPVGAQARYFSLKHFSELLFLLGMQWLKQ